MVIVMLTWSMSVPYSAAPEASTEAPSMSISNSKR